MPLVPNTNLILKAYNLAKESKGCGPNGVFKVGAILFNRNRIIKAKTNVLKTHPILSSFTSWPFLHAETNCLISHGLDNCKGLSLLVVRTNKKGTKLNMAKPCYVCEQLIYNSGIKHTFYSDWNGEVKCL